MNSIMFEKHTSEDFWMVKMLMGAALAAVLYFSISAEPVAVQLGLTHNVAQAQVGQAASALDPDDYRYTVVEGKDHIGMPASQGVADELGHHGFRFGCVPSHFSYDDPVVYPGEEGRAHLHMFYGNTDVDYLSTSDSIINSGDSTCQGGIVNRSAYWVPTLFNENDEVVLPDGIILYYKSWVTDRSQIQPIPAGLQILANDQILNSSGLTVARPGHPEDAWGSNIRVDDHDGLSINIIFPDCVAVDDNGDPILTSPGGTSHVAYSDGSCPASHPYNIPQLTQGMSWSDVPYESDWYLASDPSPAEHGTTAHADYVAGWTEEAAEIMAECTRVGARECGPPYPDGDEENFFTPAGEQFYRYWNQLIDPSEKTPSALAGWPKTLGDHVSHGDHSDDEENHSDHGMGDTHDNEEMDDTDESDESDSDTNTSNDSSDTDTNTSTENDNETPSITDFESGDRIVTSDNLNVRSVAGLEGQVLGVQQTGDVGTIGIQSAVEVDGYVWVYVNFDSGADGYVADTYLSKFNEGTEPDRSELLEIIADLLEQVADLQERLNEALEAEEDTLNKDVIKTEEDKDISDKTEGKEESSTKDDDKEETSAKDVDKDTSSDKEEAKVEDKDTSSDKEVVETKSDSKFDPGDNVYTLVDTDLLSDPNGDLFEVLPAGTVAFIPTWFTPFDQDGVTWVKLNFNDNADWGYVDAADLEHYTGE